MNGYQMTADSYRKLLEIKKDLNREAIEKKIKALDFLATCDNEEIIELFNSSAFNDIVNGYFEMAIDNMGLEAETKSGLLNELRYLFDTKTADEANAYYNRR